MGSEVYDVFVSYSRSDEAGAAELNSWLCSQGLSTFFDRNKLRAGLRWVSALEDAIGRSRPVAVLVGRRGIGNTQQYERELALVRQTQDATLLVIPKRVAHRKPAPARFSTDPGSTRKGQASSMRPCRRDQTARFPVSCPSTYGRSATAGGDGRAGGSATER